MAACMMAAGAAVVLPSRALAQPAAPTVAEVESGSAAVQRRVPARSFQWLDYLGTALALGGYYAVEYGLKPPTEPTWTEPVPLIDEPFRRFIVLDSRAARDSAAGWSDRFSYAVVAYPVLLTFVAPMQADGGVERFLQLNLMNLQSYSVSSLVTRLPHKLVGRTRPSVLPCESDGDYDHLCGSRAQYASFFGGHTATAMTGAGLACAHHLHARLLGGGIADAVGCGTALALAGGVFVTRLQADRHWLSDNLVGAAVGLVSGYALPTWLYYHPFWRDDPSAEGIGWSVLPDLRPTHLGAQLMGTLP